MIFNVDYDSGRRKFFVYRSDTNERLHEFDESEPAFTKARKMESAFEAMRKGSRKEIARQRAE
jgi:hypothetical protein